MIVTINLDSRQAFDALPDVFFWPVPMAVGGIPVYHDDDGVPDPEWVKAGEPCETCGGTEWDIDVDADDDDIRIDVPCPDCLDGKPRIAITVPCEAASHEPHWAHPIDCNDGRVAVGQAVIEHGPLPIIDSHAPPWQCPKGDYIEITVSQGYVTLAEYEAFDDADRDDSGGHWSYGPGPDLGPDPASLVGTWGVICRKVEP